MILDDSNSKEILKDPRSAAEVRIATILRACNRLDAAVAGKLPVEVPTPSAEQPKPEVIAPIAVETVLEPQLDLSGELNIADIRHDIDDAFTNQIEEVRDEAA